MQHSLKFLLIIALFGVFVSIGLTYRMQKKEPILPTQYQTTSLPLTGTFIGDLPCADCAFLRLTLTLNPTEQYTLVSEYADKGTFTDNGLYKRAGDLLILTPNNQKFLILNENTLELVGQDGNPIASQFNYQLTRSETK